MLKNKHTPQAIVKRKALQEHRVAVKKLKHEIRQHKLLIKQAKLTYKITK